MKFMRRELNDSLNYENGKGPILFTDNAFFPFSIQTKNGSRKSKNSNESIEKKF